MIREDGKDANGHPILRAMRTPIKTGARWGDKVAIFQGLQPGERVVAAGQVNIENGSLVKIGAAAPTPPATPSLN